MGVRLGLIRHPCRSQGWEMTHTHSPDIFTVNEHQQQHRMFWGPHSVTRSDNKSRVGKKVSETTRRWGKCQAPTPQCTHTHTHTHTHTLSLSLSHTHTHTRFLPYTNHKHSIP